MDCETAVISVRSSKITTWKTFWEHWLYVICEKKHKFWVIDTVQTGNMQVKPLSWVFSLFYFWVGYNFCGSVSQAPLYGFAWTLAFQSKEWMKHVLSDHFFDKLIWLDFIQGQSSFLVKKLHFFEFSIFKKI